MQVDEQETTCPNCRKQLPSRENIVCPHCGDENEADDYFCGNCGAVLISRKTDERLPWSSETAAAAATVDSSDAKDESPYLAVTVDGTVFPLPREGEVNIGREDPVTGVYPEINLESFDAEEYGVSRLHARLVLEKGQVFIEDLGSLNATFVNKRLVESHSRQELYDGDEIQLAGFSLTFHSG
jgi:predicted RNA-binding Zn-ribbon protein involved in translation (DUF1610 family)